MTTFGESAHHYDWMTLDDFQDINYSPWKSDQVSRQI